MRSKIIVILCVTLVLLVGVDYLQAAPPWQAPKLLPPLGNVSAPINTSTTTQNKTGVLGVDGLAVFGADITITDVAPFIKFDDTNPASPAAYFVRTANKIFQIFRDRDADGVYTYGGDAPAAMSLFADVASSTDYVRFSNKVRASKYCDYTGKNCFEPASKDGDGGGNQVVYLEKNNQWFNSTFFQSISPIPVSFDLTAAGYPPNIVRAYILLDSRKGGGLNPPILNVKLPLNVTNTVNLVPKVVDYANATVHVLYGAWVPVKGGKLDFVLNCNDASCGGVNRNEANIQIGAYECSGECQPGLEKAIGNGIARSCLVEFPYVVNGSDGNVKRRVYGAATSTFGIGLWAQDGAPLSVPFTEKIWAYNWGDALFDYTEQSEMGFFTPEQWTVHSVAMLALPGPRYRFASVPLIKGTRVKIATNVLAASATSTTAVNMVAEVGNCTR